MPTLNINSNTTLADALTNDPSSGGIGIESPDQSHVFTVGDNKISATGNAFTWNNDDVATEVYANSVAQTAEDNANTYADGLISSTITNGVTDKAPSEDAVYDALGLKYRSEQFFTTSNQSVADGGVYIFGQTGAPANVASLASKVPVLAGTVVAVATSVFSASTIGSSEGGTLKFFYNDGANSITLANDFKVDANRSFFRVFTGLSTAINNGDCYIEYTAPTLATNPTAIRWMVTVYIK